MWRKFFVLALAASLQLTAQAAELKAWVLQGDAYPNHQGLNYFLDQLRSRSNGKFDGKLFSADNLGDQKKALGMFRSGELDFAVLSNGALSQAVPEMKVMSLPFIFKNADHMFRTLNGEIGQNLERNLAQHGFVVLAWYDGGTRNFFSRSKPVRYASDLAGLKVRVANRSELQRMLEALGAQSVNLPYEQVRAALDNGSLDAAENDILSYQLSEQYKSARYYTISHYSVVPEALAISTQLWQKLTPAEQALVRQTARDSANEMRAIWAQKTATIRKQLEKEGVKFYEMRDNSSFITRMNSVYSPILSNPSSGDLMLKVMTLGQTQS